MDLNTIYSESHQFSREFRSTARGVWNMADEVGQKWDRCLSDSAVKFVTGLGIGALFSVILFKRRAWPIAFGAGMGVGMAYSNCQHDFRSPYLIHGRMVKDQ